jgi:hypothetical protein
VTASAFSIPHVTEFLTVDATRLVELRDRLRALPAAADLKLTPLAVVAKALCVAVRSYPLMNSSWDEDAGDIVVKGWVNLGIATDTPTGLLVPNIKDADTLGILDLSRELVRLTGLARERKAAPADLTGGTITITNVGGFGVETGTPIINKPECAILATGLIAPRPWVVDGQLAVGGQLDLVAVERQRAAQGLPHRVVVVDNDSPDDTVEGTGIGPFEGARVQVQTGGNVKAGPALHDGTLFVGNYSGQMYAIRAKDGAIRWTSSDLGAGFGRSGLLRSPPRALRVLPAGRGREDQVAVRAGRRVPDAGGAPAGAWPPAPPAPRPPGRTTGPSARPGAGLP